MDSLGEKKLDSKKGEYKRIVLVVDDEDVNRQMLGAILESDYEVIYAEDGQDAINQIKAHRETLSLVLLDLLMPELDGYEVLKWMKEGKTINRIPVIVLTSEKSAEVKSLQMGAADFLAKPYDLPEVILARVRHSIELSEDANIIKATENDHLTGLYTREFFFQYGKIFDHHHPELAMDAIVLNFNRFHLINELYGRAFGDTVLVAIADGIRGILEESSGIACRYDADTFYLYTIHMSDYDRLLRKILKVLSGVLKAPEMRIRLGIYPDIYRAASLEERFDRALQACNSLRNKYSGSFAVYDMDMHEREVYSARLLEDFEQALEEKQFKVLYQPKYNITGDRPRLCSAEALISWQHPKFGRVRPDAFIPLFEENGLIQKLDRYVWREAAEQMRKWRINHDIIIPISVNVSRVDIYDPEMPEFLDKIVRENEVNPRDYLLEITESAYTDNSRQIVQVVKDLREAGFRVEMDDFGSGYSSLNMLTALPIDALKLDMAFIKDISVDNKEMRMVELVLEIADFLQVPVVAEGVEVQEQYELLKKAGCDIIQGYYFSRPIPPEEFGRLIIKEKKGE
ncbi:MAG: EAL domain-containing protein [Lachnospiraceae bacterium]|nr:EAL domain-containing protein [Lachnospiraceae bacterium]